MMKKVLLKTICLILSVVFMFPLAACGAKTDVLYVLSFKSEYNDFFEYVNEIYLSENTDIKKIDYSAVDLNDFESVFDSRIQSEYLDVFTSEVSYMMQGISTYMLPLEEKPYFSKIDPSYLDLGKYYDPAVGDEPKQLTQVYEEVGVVVFYDKDFFELKGKNAPKTWTEFKQLCDDFSKMKTEVASPLMFGGLSSWPASTILNAVVPDTIELNDPDFFDNIKNYDNDSSIRFNSSDWVRAFERADTIGGYISNQMFGISYDYAASYFSNGLDGKKCPMMIDGTWAYTQIDPSFELGYFILPTEDASPSSSLAPLNANGKKNFATKPGMTFSVFKESNKPDKAQTYLELLYRDDVYAKFLEMTKMPSVMTDIEQNDEFINSIFKNNSLDKVMMYDSRMPKYMPLPSSSALIALMKDDASKTPQNMANDLQDRVEREKAEWQKYVNLSHTK